MLRILGFIRAALLCYLPEIYRPASAPPEIELVVPCRVGGYIVAAVGGTTLFISFFGFLEALNESIIEGPDILGNPNVEGYPALMLFGVGMFLNFVLRPTTLLLFYIFMDGLLRTYFTFTGEVYGALILYPFVWVHLWLQPRYLERSLGPRVPDRVEWAEDKSYDLLIGTCRRKPRWDRLITIRFQDRLYEVLKERKGVPPYRFHYELRRNPRSRVTRKIYDYDPDEAVKSDWQLDRAELRKL